MSSVRREFRLPDLGEGLTEAEVVAWRVAPGDTVAVNDVLVEVETAKAAVELPSPFAGTVAALLVEPGRTVPVGTPIVAIETGRRGSSRRRRSGSTRCGGRPCGRCGCAGGGTGGALIGEPGPDADGDARGLRARGRPARRRPSNTCSVELASVLLAVALTLALSGSFAQIALVSALARLLMYAGSAAATLRLRSIPPAGMVKPARFVAPFGATMPIVAIGVCVVLAAGATMAQLLSGIVALLAGAALFATQIGRQRAARSVPT